MAKRIKVCSACGSDNVVSDAWVRWDVASQEGVLDDVFPGDDFCHACEAGTTIKDREIEAEESNDV
jgi:hypothetical protein